MDFDEIDYLEKMLENPNSLEVNETANGIDGGSADKSGANEGSRRSSKHQRDEMGASFDRRSKRVKRGDEAHDGQRHTERSSGQPRLSSRDGERGEKDRHRSSREHRVQGRYYRDRDQQKEWQRGHNRNRRLQDREREGRGRHHQSEKEKGESEREGEKETEDSRQSGSNTERPRSRDNREDSERIQGGDFKEKEKEKELRDNTNRRYKDKKESNTELEVDPERDQRTVFAYQISLKADERDAYEFFSRAGKVRDVRLIMDRNSRRSKGVGYVEFYDAMSVPMAIALSGQPLLGQPVMVKPSEAEKNLVQSTAATTGGSSGASGSYSGGGRRLYVGNLHFNITEDQLRQVFESFGTVELVQLPLDQETGHCKGFGFIQFARLEDARAAQSLDGQLDIAGRIIKVSVVTDQAGTQDVGANAADFDDDEGGGMSLNARSRSLLMQKLDRTGTASGFAGSLSNSVVSSAALSLPVAPILGTTPMVYPLVASLMQTSVPPATVPTIESVGVPSECLLLKNMFDPSSETEPDFDMDIKEDVVEESKKFGKLKHIHVDKNSAGFVYLQFENTPSAINAQQALHGRWFAGKMITATYMLPQNYEAKFLNM